jgi:serpin B
MRKLQLTLTVVLVMLSLDLLVPGPALCSDSGSEAGSAARSVNAFAIDLYGQIRKPEGNFIFSPYSVSMALIMAYAGASGTTASQIAGVLHLRLSPPRVPAAFAEVNALVLAAGRGKTAELHIANALWAENSYTFKKEYLESVRTNFTQRGWFPRLPVVRQVVNVILGNDEGCLRQLDFRHHPDASRKTINRWVEAQTEDRIKDLLAPGTIASLTRLVLTNAIYFKGKWESQFRKELTRVDSFTLLNGADAKVPMMRQIASCGYAEERDLQVLEMKYRGGDLSMVVLLPAKHKPLGLEEFERSLTPERLDQWIQKLETRRVEVFLPRFRMTSQCPLKTALIGLGMTNAFSPQNADFSGMTGNHDLFIQESSHKAFVEVNEEGTEAAAATGHSMKLLGAPRPSPVFRADHPFVFLIRHRPSHCILFMGRATKP